MSVYTDRAVAPDWQPATPDAPYENALELVHLGDLSWEAFKIPVPNPAIAGLFSLALSRFDLFLEDQGFHGDFMNAGGLNQFDGDAWYDWMGENGEEFDRDVFDIEMTYQDDIHERPVSGTYRLTCHVDGADDTYVIYAQNVDELLACQTVLTNYARIMPYDIAMTTETHVLMQEAWVETRLLSDAQLRALTAPYTPTDEDEDETPASQVTDHVDLTDLV